MTTLFERSSSVRHKALARTSGINVTYRRGNDSLDGLTAIAAQVRHDDFGDEQDSITAREKDWLVWAGDLAVGGTQTEPQRDDEIDWIDANGLKRTYKVLPRAGDRCYRFTDQTQQQYRIFTVEQLPSAE